MQTPSKNHLNAAKSLLRYLNQTKNYYIEYNSKGNLIPKGFFDSDFAGDKASSKSTYGYLFKISGGPVSWKSKKGSTVCLSTTEAEYTALTEATKEVEWIKGLYSEINIISPLLKPILLKGDNLGANAKAKNPVMHARTKHTLLKFHYVQEKVKEGVILVEYIDTKNMPADGLIKTLPPIVLKRFLELINIKIK